MPFPNEISARIKTPGQFTRFARKNNKGGEGVDFVYGIKNGKSEIQAVRFDASKFDVSKAKEWLKRNKMKAISVTPASKKKKDHVSSADIAVPASSTDLTIQYKDHAESLKEPDLKDLVDELMANDIDMKQLEMGMDHEMEHTNDRMIALQIALDHLKEIGDYYTRLEAMEEQADSDRYEEEEEKEHKDHAEAPKYKEVTDNLSEGPIDLEYNEDENSLTVEAFKSGTHTDAAGETCTYKEQDLADMAKKYNEKAKSDPAPVCVGHPSDNSPSYGWIQKAYAVGEKLYLKLGELNHDFVDMLKAGTFKKRSLSMYEDGSIRHLGYLGGMPPAVKGLNITSFNSQEKYHEFTEELKMEDSKTILSKIKTLLGLDKKDHNEAVSVVKLENEGTAESKPVSEMAGSKTKEEANKDSVAKEEVDEGTTPDARKKADVAEAKNESNKTQKEYDELKEKYDKAMSELESIKKLVEQKEAEKVHVDEKPTSRAFCENLVREGKLRPADLDVTIKNLDDRIAVDTIRNYSEEDPMSGAKAYKKHLASQPKIIAFAEIPNLPPKDALVNVPNVTNLDEYIGGQIKDKMSLNPNISYEMALEGTLMELKDKHPSMYSEYHNRAIPEASRAMCGVMK